MNNKIDLLFKSTLANHQIVPGEKAWSAIEGKLVKKNNHYLWIKLAAGLVVGALLVTYWTKPTPRNINNHLLADEAPAKASTPGVLQENKENTIIPIQENTPATPPKKQVANTKPDNKTDDLLAVVEMETSHEAITAITALPEEKTTEDNMPAHPQSGAHQSMVLVYTLPPVKPTPDLAEEKYDQHKVEKHNNLKKIWELAGDLRTGESNLNSVRQTKNEILAFHFIKNEKSN